MHLINLCIVLKTVESETYAVHYPVNHTDSVGLTRRRTLRARLKILLLLFSALGVANTAVAQEIKIVTELFHPFQVLDEEEHLTGYSVDVVKALVREAGEAQEPDIEILPWTAAYERALTQANTLIFSMSRSGIREKKFKWLAPVASEKPYFWALSSANIPSSNKISDFSQYRIGVIKDAVNHQYLSQNGFENLYLMAGMDANAGEAHRVRMLLAGRADIVISPRPTILAALESLQQPENLLEAVHRASDLDNELYIAFNIDTEPFILTRYQQAMQRLQQQGVLLALRKKWRIE